MEERSYSSKIWLTTGFGTSIFYCFSNFSWGEGNFEWIALAAIFIAPITFSIIIHFLTFPVWFILKVINYLALKNSIKFTNTRTIIQGIGICMYTLIYIWLKNSILTSKPFLWEENNIWAYIGCLITFTFSVWYFEVNFIKSEKDKISN